MKTMTNFKQITQLIILCIPSLFIAQEENIFINNTLFISKKTVVDKDVLITTSSEYPMVKIAGKFEVHNRKDSPFNKIIIKPLAVGHKIHLLHKDPNLQLKSTINSEFSSRFWLCRDNDGDETFPKGRNVSKLKSTITFPNPVLANLNVKAPHKIIQYQLLDRYGKLLKQQETSSKDIIISMSTLNKGHYYLKVQLENQTQETLQIFKN